MLRCSECSKEFYAWRDYPFGKRAAVCSKVCARARKSRLQRERRHESAGRVASRPGTEIRRLTSKRRK